MAKMISVIEWALRHDVPCKVARGWARKGLIPSVSRRGIAVVAEDAKPPEDLSRWITVEEYAKRAGLTGPTVYRRLGELETRQVEGVTLIRVDSVVYRHRRPRLRWTNEKAPDRDVIYLASDGAIAWGRAPREGTAWIEDVTLVDRRIL